MATRSKVSKKRAAGKETRKARAKTVKTAAIVKSLSRKGGGRSQSTRGRARSAGVLDRETDQPTPRAVKKWTN